MRYSLLLACLCGALEVFAWPSTYTAKRADNTQAVGTNPVSKFSTQYLGFQHANNSASHRDLGFTGSLCGKWYAVYGDTLWAAPGVTDPAKDTPGFHGMVRDSLSQCTSDPLTVVDLNLNSGGRQLQFVPFNSSWGEDNTYGFGGTSLAETSCSDQTAAVFYLVNANDKGLKGAGVARVKLIGGTPTVTQRYGSSGWWWDASKNARYGDVATFRDPKSSYIYAWGGAPTSATGWVDAGYVYLTRVKATDAFDLTKYEYFWGKDKGWKKNLLTTFDSSTAVFWNSGQGQLVWNDHYGCYMFVGLTPGGSDVYIRTAASPEGPWTPMVKVYTATPMGGGMTYAGVAHPYLDSTGKTLVISYTNNNQIEVIRVTFS